MTSKNNDDCQIPMDIISEHFHYKDPELDNTTVCDHCGKEFSTMKQQWDIEQHLVKIHPEKLKEIEN